MKAGPGSGIGARDGDVGIYQECTDEACPVSAELGAGRKHAHLIRVERADGSTEEIEDGNG